MEHLDLENAAKPLETGVGQHHSCPGAEVGFLEQSVTGTDQQGGTLGSLEIKPCSPSDVP